ncbi:MAG: acyl-CoA dehydrogenase family protein [bacterium]
MSINQFKGVDFYLLDDLLTTEEKLIRQSVRDFVDRKFMPRIKQAYRDGVFPLEIVPGLAGLGVFGASIDGYGCNKVSSVSYGLMMQELERGDSGLRSFASVHSSLAMTAIYQFGSEEQKRFWLPQLANGNKIGCFGLTEPDFGSNPAGMHTIAIKDNGHYILNGTKMWITNGSIADVAVVWAKTKKDDPKSIKGFIVEKGMPGFTARDIHGKLSMRASITSELNFDECRIPEDHVLPKSDGLKSPLICLMHARYSIAWGAIGAAMACYEEALNYAKERVQFSKPIAGYQLIQEKLVWMLSEITKAQLLAWRMGTMLDAGKLKHYHVSLAKMNNVRIALNIARECRDILGANGIIDDYQCMRHMANLESVYTYEGTNNIHTLILGEYITGIRAFD